MLLALMAVPRSAHADQPRDYMLRGQPGADRLLMDYLGIGTQLSYERRRSFFQGANDYTLSASALASYPLGQVGASAAVRFLWFELGVALGYRTVWRNLSFEPGDNSYCKDCDRAARRARDPILGKGPDSDHFWLADARLQLYAPMNDYFVLTSALTANYQGLRPRSYDWFLADVHDPGVIVRWELMAFVKHRKWGGIGPYLQLQALPRGDKHVAEFAAGFNLVSRVGLVARRDMLFVTVLVRPGDDMYGQHAYFAPLRALFFYRLELML